MKHSLKDGSGYLEVDHSESPGLLPADVAHLPGAVAVGPGEVYKTDVQQCAHCQTVVVLNPKRTRPRGFCAKCNHYVCDHPVCNATCQPVAKLFDRAQEHAAKYVNQPDHPDAAPAPRLLMTDSPRVTVPADVRPSIVITDQ